MALQIYLVAFKFAVVRDFCGFSFKSLDFLTVAEKSKHKTSPYKILNWLITQSYNGCHLISAFIFLASKSDA